MSQVLGQSRRWRRVALVAVAGLVSYPVAQLRAATVIAQTSKPTVVATTSVLCDITQTIAQDTVDLKCLVEAGSDPHLYRPQPTDARSIETADLILYAGYDFEPAIIQMIKATSNNSPKIAVSEVAVPNPIMGEPHDHGEEAAAHEHDHEEGLAPDPHVFHNAEHGADMAKVVAAILNSKSKKNQLGQVKHQRA